MTKEERRQYYRKLELSLNEQERRDIERERRERHLRANARWHKKRVRTVSCKVPKDTAEQFVKLCYRHGKTPYRALKDAIEAAVREDASCSTP